MRGYGVDLGATFGAAKSGGGVENPDAVRHEADKQMLRAKEAGKSRIGFAAGPVVDLRT